MTEPHFKAALIELSNDAVFIEKICMQHQIQIERAQKLLREFYTIKALTSEYLQLGNKLDVRRNFVFWVPSQLTRDREAKEKELNTSKTGKVLTAVQQALDMIKQKGLNQ